MRNNKRPVLLKRVLPLLLAVMLVACGCLPTALGAGSELGEVLPAEGTTEAVSAAPTAEPTADPTMEPAQGPAMESTESPEEVSSAPSQDDAAPSPDASPSASPEASSSPAPAVTPAPETEPDATPVPEEEETSPAPIPPPASPSPTPLPEISKPQINEILPLTAELDGSGMGEFITGGKLYTDSSMSTEVPGNHSVHFNEPFYVHYGFAIPSGKMAALKAASQTDTHFAVPLPTNLMWNSIDGAGALPITFAGETAPFAYLHLGGAIPYITFVYDQIKDEDSIEQGEFYFSCLVDSSLVGGPEDIEVRVQCGSTYSINLPDNHKTDGAIAKEALGYSTETGRFTWKITYTPGTKTYEDLLITDTFDEKQEYVAGSAKDGAGSSLSPTLSDNVLAFAISPVPGDPAIPYVITYETGFSDEGFQSYLGGQEVTVENHVSFSTGASAEPIGSAQASTTVEGGDAAWIAKAGEFIDSKNGKAVIRWTLTLNIPDRSLSALRVYDCIPNGLTVDSAPTVAGWTGAAYTPVNGLFTYHAVPGNSDTNGAYTFHMDSTGPYAYSTYQITYETTIPSDDFSNSAGDKTYKNIAWLEFSWQPGIGPGMDHITPTVEKAVTAATNGVKKECIAGYNPGTHLIKWRVTVNPHEISFPGSAVLTDSLADKDQEYVSDSFQTTDGAYLSLDRAKTNSTVLVVNANHLGTASASYEFETRVTNPAHYASNNPEGVPYRNTVVCSTGTWKDISASAATTVKSQMVEKTFSAYDYNTHLITWRVVVNQNEMKVNGVTLTDTISRGQSYVQDSAKPEGSATPLPGVTAAGGKLTIPLGNLTKKTTLTYQTKLDVNSIRDFLSQDKVTVDNTVELHSTDYDYVADSTASGTINNRLLTKSGTLQKNKDSIDYSVFINPNAIELNTSQNILSDRLPAGLLLDPDTAVLYEAVVQANGSLAEGSPCDTSSYSVSYDAMSKTMTIVLPTNVSKAFLLKYSADVVNSSAGPFVNSITFTGADMGGASSDKEIASYHGGGGALRSRKGSLEITKVDSLDKNVLLSGVGFGIYKQSSPDIMVDYQVTGTDGKATFSALTLGSYVVKELSVPEGYLLPVGDRASFSITIDKTASVQEFTKQIENTRVTGDLSFQKVNDWGLSLQGAEFSLTNKPGTPAFSKAAESTEDGSVLFENVPFGEYTLRETKVPVGHHTAEDMDVVVDKDGAVSITGAAYSNGKVTDLSQKASLQLKKTSFSTGLAMEGVEFTLTDSQGIRRGMGKTDANGRLTFTALMIGEAYTLHETPYPGYQPLTDQSITLAAAENDVMVVELKNAPVSQLVASLTIHKRDSSTGKAMEGVLFQLTDEYGFVWGSAATDESGCVSFFHLPIVAAYTIHEDIPQGYEDVPDRRITLSEAREYVMTWENTPIASPSPAPDPTPDPADPIPGTPTPEVPSGGTPGEGNNKEDTQAPSVGQGAPGDDDAGTGSGRKLPQTGENQALPWILLGAGAALVGAGALGLRKPKKHRCRK